MSLHTGTATAALGLLVAAYSVRMVSGTKAAAVVLTVMVLLWWTGQRPGTLLLIVASLLLSCLKVRRLPPIWRFILPLVLLSCACLQNLAAVLLCPIAALAIVFETLTPDSGLHPWAELRVRWRNARPIWIQTAAFIVVPGACAMFSATRNTDHWPTMAHRYPLLTLALSLVAALWLLSGFREANGIIVAFAGLPLLTALLDEPAGQPLLSASAVTLGALVIESYRVKHNLS